MTKTILIVDDDPHIRMLLTSMLERHQFIVCQAEHITAAWQVLERQVPDLCILDYMLPKMSGADFCRALRERAETANLPVLMLSARSDSNAVQASMAAGATAYLSKPINREKLIAQIASMLTVASGA